jgi:hypothetical protein
LLKKEGLFHLPIDGNAKRMRNFMSRQLIFKSEKMVNLVIASFKDEATAKAASQKLSKLESIGDITIYESVIVKKS